VIIAFKEDEDLGPPYRRDELAAVGGADYLPRSVNLLLEHSRLRQGRFQWLPEMPDLTKPSDVRAFLGSKTEASSSLEIPWLHGGNPLKIVRHLFPFGRQFRAHWSVPVPKSDCGCSIEAWRRYSAIIKADAARGAEARYGPTLYARVIEGRELAEIGPQSPLSRAVAIQYWWFIFYNDAWNRHQGDWEGITVFLVPDGDRLTPIGSAYASHDQGRWRRWEDVHRLDDAEVESPDGLHPLVYMARGSHASYFDYNSTGYHPSMSRKFRLPFLGDFEVPSHMVLQSRTAVDWVADRRGSGSLVIAFDDVRVMPPEEVLTDPVRLRADDDWWWLAYEGLWGAPEPLPFFGGSGPRGPRLQGVKWDNPFTWVMRECMADDLPYWIKTFARWQMPESATAVRAPVAGDT
jgi:hypothetical protein